MHVSSTYIVLAVLRACHGHMMLLYNTAETATEIGIALLIVVCCAPSRMVIAQESQARQQSAQKSFLGGLYLDCFVTGMWLIV